MPIFEIKSTHEINGIVLPSKESAERVLLVSNAFMTLIEKNDLSDYEISAVRQLIFPQTREK